MYACILCLFMNPIRGSLITGMAIKPARMTNFDPAHLAHEGLCPRPCSSWRCGGLVSPSAADIGRSAPGWERVDPVESPRTR